MKQLIILIVFLLVVVGLLGYMNYEQTNIWTSGDPMTSTVTITATPSS